MKNQKHTKLFSKMITVVICKATILAVLGISTSCQSNDSADEAAKQEATTSSVVANNAVTEYENPSNLVSADTPISFNEHIQPILSEYCYHCHGPDSGSREPKASPLRLDQEESAFEIRENGKPVIIKGNPEDSYLMQLVRSTDKVKVMPPHPSKNPHGKIMDQSDIELLHRWIEEGAVYEDHWAYIAPKKSTLPEIANKDWVRNEVDYFVAAKLDKSGLKPNEQESESRLIRRLYLDLTGLPPSAEELDSILGDQRDFDTVYNEKVDQLMNTDAYAEHWTRNWLDVARYGDTHGIHLDNYRSIWPYRDWVIKAFKNNMPFDQFTREQIAGDMMPNVTTEQKIATGFNRCNPTTGEGGAIPEEYDAIYAQDRVDTVSSAWLGLTFGCAACHDHKFDAISQKENFQLTAFFRNTTMHAMDGNAAHHPPFINIFEPKDQEMLDKAHVELADMQKLDREYRAKNTDKFLAWVTVQKTSSNKIGSQKLLLPLHNAEKGLTDSSNNTYTSAKPLTWVEGPNAIDKGALFTGGNTIDLGQIGSFNNDQSFSYSAWIKVPQGTNGAVFSKMYADNTFRGYDLYLVNGKLNFHIINSYPGDAIKVITHQNYPDNVWTHVTITYDGKGKAAGAKIYINGKSASLAVEQDSLKGTIITDAPLKIGSRSGDVAVENAAVYGFRMFDKALTDKEIERLFIGAELRQAQSLVSVDPAEAKKAQHKLSNLKNYYFENNDKTVMDNQVQINAIKKQIADIQRRSTPTLVMDDKKDSEPHAHVLIRGVYSDKGERVTPDTPASLPPMGDLPRNRLGLAHWITSPENPLPARVTVNRYWYYIFGRGIIETNGDFGIMGARPTHPQLLDWLAKDFVENDWDLHHLLRKIVTSATYRQSGRISPEKLEKDPQNILLSRGPRYRMDGEKIRDLALKASGLLNPKVGGPSVKPYQPKGVWSSIAMTVSNTKLYKQDMGDKLYRRSLYTFWKRMAPHPAMEIFNAPSREISCVQRDRTNTPLQAFVLLNDPQFVEASRHLAEKAIKGASTDSERIDFISKRLIAREMRTMEHESILQSLDTIRERIAMNPEEASKLAFVGESKPDASLNQGELAAWTLVANLILNLDETVNK